ncbi:MAG: NAD-dependent epimerase/dehydratase family protein [Planctomycetota bacterium]|jgi:UDP-glucose 4-epimerase
MRYLVTGGAGFIGSHLVESLLAEGHEAVVLDDLSTGRRENLAAVADHPGLRFVEGDIKEPAAVESAMEGCEAVFHLAAAVGVRLIVERPVECMETNIHGTEVVLRAAAARDLPVLVASSSEVYGKGASCPFREEDDLLLGPTTVTRWSYAASKAVDEFLALAHGREHGTRVVIARFFNTVGPRQVGQYGMVIPRFIGQALDGDAITVYGDGHQTRCFGFVGEVVKVVRALLDSPEASGKVFNVGSPHEVSIGDLAEKVRTLVNPNASIRTIPFEEAYGPGFEDLGRRVPCVDRLTEAIGFTPERTLDDFLPEIIEDVKARRESASAT